MKILQEIKVPKESVNDEFLNVVGIPFKNGDKVIKNDLLLELETSKAVLTIEAEEEGFIQYLCKIGEDVEINKTVIKIWDEIPIDELSNKEEKKEKKEIDESYKSSKNIPINEIKVNNTFYSKKASSLIEVNKIDLKSFENFDFVNEQIVLSILNIDNSPILSSTVINPIRAKDNFAAPSNFEKVELVKISNSKKREIEYLQDVQHSGLVSVINIDLDIEHVFENTNKSIKYFTDSALPLLTYECSRLLIKYPMFNSYFFNGDVLHYKDINIGIAMDIDDGLKVVNIKNTNLLNLNDIDFEIYDLALKYMDKKLTIDQLSDTTFTITDLSSFGAISFSPLINKNNAAILGIAKVDSKLNRINLSLAFDHRVSEGKTASLFLQELKERFESYKLSVFELNEQVTCSKCFKSLNDDLNGIGFIKIINNDFKDSYLCDSCLFKF